MNAKQLLSYGLLAASLSLSSGCMGTTYKSSVHDSLVAMGVTGSESLPVAPKSRLNKSKWHVKNLKDAKEIGPELEKLLTEINPEIVAVGELPMPVWVQSRPTAYRFVRDCLPAFKKQGFNDLVAGYITQDVTDKDLEDAVKDDDVITAAHASLGVFNAEDLIVGCRKNGIKLHKGGYMPDLKEGKVLTFEQYHAKGRRDWLARENDYFVDILGEIKKNSVDQIIKLNMQKKKALAYGLHDSVDLNEEALHAYVTFFNKDRKLYEEMHQAASFAKEFREEGFGKKFMAVRVVVPDFIPHDSLLTVPDLRLCWDMKSKDRVRILYQTVEDCYNVIVLYPFEGASSGKSLEDKVIRSDVIEEPTGK